MTNLKRIIDEKGVQQRWLAEQIGVTEVSMSRYVSGERIPKAPLAIKMADALGVDVKELYGWDDEHVVGEDEEMTTEEAAEVLRNTAWLGTHDERERIEKAVEMAINALTLKTVLKEKCLVCEHCERCDSELAKNSPKVDSDFGDLISRQAVLDWLKNEWNGMVTSLFDGIKALPSAQPIIRCKDCKNSEYWYRDRRRCFLWSEDGVSVFDDGYCNYAERRNDG